MPILSTILDRLRFWERKRVAEEQQKQQEKQIQDLMKIHGESLVVKNLSWLFMPSNKTSVLRDLTMATLSVLLIVVLQIFFNPYLRFDLAPYLLTFMAIMLSGWWGGLRSGLFATGLSVFAVKLIFLPTVGSLVFSTSAEVYQLMLFMFEGLAISLVWEGIHSNFRQMQEFATRLLESEQKYKMVVENANDLVSVIDTSGNILYASPSFEKVLGFRPADLIGTDVFRNVHPDDIPQAKKELETILSGTQMPMTVRYRHKRGNWLVLEGTGSAILDRSGKPYLIVSSFRNITERQRYEEEIREHLSLLNTVIEGISDAVFVKDLQGRYVLINSAAAKYIDKPADQIIGKQASDFFSEETVKQIAASEEQALDTEQTVRYDETIVRDGKLHTYLSTKTAYRNAEGDIIGFVGISHDITDRKRYENQLEDLNKRISSILASITDAFFALDREGKFIFINKQAERLLNISEAQIIGQSVWDKFPEIIDSSFFTKYFRAIATNKPVTFEKEYKPLKKCFEIHAYPSKDGVSIYLSDITERKHAEDALKENEERFRLLSEMVPQIIWTSKPNGDSDYFNKRWYDYTGLKEEQSKGMRWVSAVHEEDVEKQVKLWKQSVRTGQVFESNMRLKKVDGSYRWHLVRAIPIRNAEGVLVKWFGSATDIDEQKKLDERKDEFISTASHELKTPITTIKAFTQLLRARFSDNKYPDVSLYLYKMEYQVNRLKTLINDLLDVSKIQAGKMEFFDKEFDFDNMVQEAVEDMQPAIESHEIIVKGRTSKTVFGDRYRIGQVLVNLINNAIKYSPKADKVIVHVKKEGSNVTIGVQDFGVGIPPEEINKIFGRFYRVNGSHGERFEGMGLGLHISMEIIKRHNGRLWVDSTEGKGSTFYFSVPSYKDLKEQEEYQRPAQKLS